jgi:hypothetical protein
VGDQFREGVGTTPVSVSGLGHTRTQIAPSGRVRARGSVLPKDIGDLLFYRYRSGVALIGQRGEDFSLVIRQE